MMLGRRRDNASVAGAMPELLTVSFSLCAVVACVAGMVRGLAGMAGPPIAFYYLAGNETVTRVRANLTTYFVFVDLMALVMFLSRDLIDLSTGILGLFLAPAVILGGIVGGRLFPLASESFY